MARVLIVDDSASVRTLLQYRLRKAGHDVNEAATGESGVESALLSRPDVIVTDLNMTGISGVQLCRILRAEPTTAHIPVVLLTASGDKRSRFRARSAGAAAYVCKDRLEDLIGLLQGSLAIARPPANSTARSSAGQRSIEQRISAVLDTALFEAVVASEVRALASLGGKERMFDGLVALMADLLNYRCMAMLPARRDSPVFAHARPEDRERVIPAACAALGVSAARAVHVVADERAVIGTGESFECRPVVFGDQTIGRLALAPGSNGFSPDDLRTLSIVATELSGPLQMSALYEDVERVAAIDELTGLLNRRAFLAAVERERARSERYAQPFSLLLIDIDHFKVVNDRYGHAAGDEILKGVARVLTNTARRSDVVARWGGEEFVVALPQTGAAGARVAAERVRRAIALGTYRASEEGAFQVTGSVGFSSSNGPWGLEAIMAAADAAMYKAKKAGRNRVEEGLIDGMTKRDR